VGLSLLCRKLGGKTQPCVWWTERRGKVGGKSAPGFLERSGLEARISDVGEAFWAGRVSERWEIILTEHNCQLVLETCEQGSYSKRLPGPTVSTRGLHEASQRLSSTTSTTYSMGLCISTTSRLRSTRRIDQGAISVRFQSTERIGQDVIGGESQRQRYACSPVTLIGLRVNMDHGQQSTYCINPHPR
jgi:hypothetical protein